jgi:hypothetical protein
MSTAANASVCAKCGKNVPQGEIHWCLGENSSSSIPATFYNQPFPIDDVTKRLLERIAVALEKIAKI